MMTTALMTRPRPRARAGGRRRSRRAGCSAPRRPRAPAAAPDDSYDFARANEKRWPVGAKCTSRGTATRGGGGAIGPYAGKARVRYADGSMYHVNPEELAVPVCDAGRAASVPCSVIDGAARRRRGLHANQTYGPAAINAIVEHTHNKPGDDIAVLMLGYEEDMMKMLRESNDGLKSRFAPEQAFRFPTLPTRSSRRSW